MNSPIFLTLALIVTSCVYLFGVTWSFRASGKRGFSTPWLLLPLSGAIIAGVTLVFSVPVSPASPVLFKLLELLAHLCNILLIWTILGKIAPTSRLAGTWLYAWNPLALIELAVYANTAGVVICLLLLAVWFSIQKRRHWLDIATLVLVGLAVRINFMTLLIAPLWLWFMVRQTRGVSAAVMGFTWRAVVVVVVLIVAYLPGWQGSATFLAITNALHLLDFANSPLGLVVMPVRGFFSFVAQVGHFPSSLMQPTTAADMMVLATSFFLFALLYLREMGKVRLRRPGVGAIPLGSDDMCGDIAQRDVDKGTGHVTPTESLVDEDKHKAPSSALPRSLSLQDEEGVSVKLMPERRDILRSYGALFTGWTVVILGYIVLAATVFSPGYLIWGVWVVALRRYDTLSVSVLLVSCSALLYYPLQQFASTLTSILLPVCVFGIPLVYLIVLRCIPAGRMERKKGLT